MKTEVMLAAAAALCTAGCIQLKTESEIKPIHITMDVNLKVDKDLDKAFADENAQSPKGDFRVAKGLLDRKVAGVTSLAMLEARPGASDDDKIAIAEENARRLKRFSEVAKKNGTSIETVQRRHAAKMREKLPAGVWRQDDAGRWQQGK
jgi:hypothetical protein